MQCSYLKEDQTPCNAYAMAESEFCYLHNPNISQEEKRRVQSKGGHIAHTRYLSRLEPLEFTNTHSVIHLLTDTINRVRVASPEGDIDTKTASVIAMLAAKLLDAQRNVQLENRIEELEIKLSIRKPRYGESSQNDQEIAELVHNYLASRRSQTE